MLVGRDLQRDLVRQLGEPADVGDDERRADRERADDDRRRLAHRRRPQRDRRVDAPEQRPQPLLGDVVLAHDRVRQAGLLDPPVELERRVGRAGEHEPRSGFVSR